MRTGRRIGTTVRTLLASSALILTAVVLWALLGTDTAHADEPGTGARVATGPAGLNVHDVAGVDEETVTAVLANGTPLDVSCLTDADGMTWVQIRSGYVATQYVTGLPTGLPPCDDTAATEPTPPPTTDGDAEPGTGAQLSDPYEIRTDSGLPVTVRQGPGTDWPVVGSLGNGARVSIGCTFYRGGRLWDKIVDGGYVADEYVRTGTTGPVASRCTLPTDGEPNDGEPTDADDGAGGGDADQLEGLPVFPVLPDSTDRPDCTLGGSEEEVRSRLFEAGCVGDEEVFGHDPGDPDPKFADVLKEAPGEPVYLPDPLAIRRPFLIQDIGPNAENSYGIRWDGCSVPEQAAVIPNMGDPSHPFGFDFLPACQVHDLGYRLIDRHILPESAEEAMDTFFAQMLGRICLNYPDRIVGCRETALAYSGAVMYADHEPTREDYPRVYTGPS